MVSRRRFLQLSAGTAAAAALGTACGSTEPAVDEDGFPDELGATTTEISPQRQSRLRDVQHVVVLSLPSASFDQVFGTRSATRGFADPAAPGIADGRGVWRQATPATPEGIALPFPADACLPSVDDSWAAQHAAWADGSMAGFAEVMGPAALGYYRRSDLPWLHAVADEFTVLDRWFSPVLGPATPNRLVALTGEIDALGVAGGPATGTGGTFAWETYPERLERAAIGWRVYQEPGGEAANALHRFVQFQEAQPGDPLHDHGVAPRTFADFEADLDQGLLPWASWITAPTGPDGGPASILDGEAHARRYVHAILERPEVWSRTVIVLVADHNGGAFDHVPPPTPMRSTAAEWVGDQPVGMGPRVPALVVSPWSRGGRTVSRVHDHTAVLRLLEHRFGVTAPRISGWRRWVGSDLLTALDLKAFDDTVPDLPPAAPRPDPMCARAWAPPPLDLVDPPPTDP